MARGASGYSRHDGKKTARSALCHFSRFSVKAVALSGGEAANHVQSSLWPLDCLKEGFAVPGCIQRFQGRVASPQGHRAGKRRRLPVEGIWVDFGHGFSLSVRFALLPGFGTPEGHPRSPQLAQSGPPFAPHSRLARGPNRGIALGSGQGSSQNPGLHCF